MIPETGEIKNFTEEEYEKEQHRELKENLEALILVEKEKDHANYHENQEEINDR